MLQKCSSQVPMLLHLLNDVAIELCRISPSCSSSLFLFHPRFLWDAPRKKDPVGEEVLQFLLPHQELINTFSTGIHEKHYGQLTIYQGAECDKPQDHAGPKSCKVQHSKELAFHGHQSDAHLSWETP